MSDFLPTPTPDSSARERSSADHPPSADTPLLVVDRISKNFGAVQALQGISFEIARGEVVALVGDNGAGKSTLVKILSGVHAPSGGAIRLNGRDVHFPKPSAALAAGIETVYQHLALIEELDVADNVYLGRETTKYGLIGRLLGVLDRGVMRRETAAALSQLHIKIPAPTLAVRMMSGGQRQAVAIGRAMTWGRQLLILDEPTAALGVEETEQVLQMIERLRAEQSLTFLIISHNMQDVYRIADKIIVLRQGRHAATLRKSATTPQEIVAYITGAK
jgi:simple sugar transport system ATP-binding protein